MSRLFALFGVLVILALPTQAYNANNWQDNAQWDYVIVGAGGGGSVMAHKLAADGSKSVLLLEQGLYACPGACQSTTGTALGSTVNLQDTNCSRHLPVPQAGALGRSPIQVSYHGLGGSTNLWGGVYNRASREVLNTFYPQGFQYNDLLPYYKSMEDHFCHYITDANPPGFPEISQSDCATYHGQGGPMQVSPADYYENFSSQMNATFLSVLAGNANNNNLMGMPMVSDCNGDPTQRAGLTFIQTYDIRANLYDRKSAQVRGSTYKGWLNPAFQSSHPNLWILPGAEALRLTFGSSHYGRAPVANGVVFTTDGGNTQRTVQANRVILSLGVINTPKFLMLNGIGPAATLQGAGIPVVANNAEVGQNLMAHHALLTGYQLTSELDSQSGEHASMGFFFSNKSALTSPDFQIAFGEDVVIETLGTYEAGPPKPIVVSAITNNGVPTNGWMNVLIINVRPTTVGSVSINKRDPLADAIVDYGWDGKAAFSADIARFLQAVQNVRQFMLSLKFPNGTSVVQQEVYPGTLWLDQINKWTPNAQYLPEALKQSLSDQFFIENAIAPVYHITGSVSLGLATDSMAQVNGVSNLHVVDNSLLPHIPDGNPTGTLMAVAQKVADAILAADNHH